jgi:hypothetical protein
VTIADAREFADAVRYLCAYQQRFPIRMQRDGKFAGELAEAIDWLSNNLRHVRPSLTKGDDPAALRTRGLEAYRRLPERDDRISPEHAQLVIQALANLYTLYQTSAEPDLDLSNAVLRLERVLDKIQDPLSKGDTVRAKPDWAPAGKKPRIARNEIRNIRIERVSHSVVRLRFDYTYVGDHGEDVFINGQALGPERQLLGIGGCCVQPQTGAGSGTLLIEKPANNAARRSVAIDVCMIDRNNGAFHCETLQIDLEW